MKKTGSKFLTITAMAILLASCYSHTYTVGEGSTTGVVVKEKNHFAVYGLAKIKTSSPTEMAGEATDYEVNTQHSFVDGLINSLTFGLYNPTTTTVTK
jgi:hypothetical protein